MSLENIQSLVNAYYKKDFQSITELIKSSPQNANTASSLTMLTSNDPFYVICALDGMAAAYTHGSNHNYALLFGIAAYECASDYLFKSAGTRKDEMVYYAASSSYLTTKSYLDMAKYDEGIKFFERTERDCKEYFYYPDFVALRLNAVELYLETDQPETARDIFNDISTNKIPPSANINYLRLNSKLKSLFTEMSVIPEEAKKSETEAKTAEIKGMLDAVSTLLVQTGGVENEETKELAVMFGNMKTSLGSLGEDDKKTFENSTAVYSTLMDYMKTLGGGTQDFNLMELRKELQESQSVFYDEKKGFDPEILQSTLFKLENLLAKFENRYIEDTKTTLWSIQICQKRLGLFAEGANTLEQLRKLLESERLQIKNKKERAGVFKAFKYLFPNLVELYYKSGNARGVLKAIEASKGRLLGDSITEQTNNEVQYDSYDLPVSKLPELLAKNKANYVSLFMDDEYSIASLVTSNGKFYAEHIPVGKTTINQWVEERYDDPKEWQGTGAKGLFSKQADIPHLLEKFLNILKIGINDGNIKNDDHLVYSPDDMLFLFPLQYVQFDNKYLIEQFSLSKIHGAYQLIHLLEDIPVPYGDAICFSIPAVNDMSDPEKISRFSEVKSWLNKNLPATIDMSDQNTVDELLSSDHIKSIIHFSTHGVFPSPGMDASKANPYYNSGLLLKNGEKLPKLEGDLIYYGQDNFLNPQKLFESNKSWRGSHITFQACVSARSKEGVGGDALGMESAAFFCGAASMLTAGWNIPIEWANKFCIPFYDFWLKKKLNKAEAYKKTMLELLKSDIPSDFPAAYYWAGMILSGDWR